MKIFLSYASEDRHIAEHICLTLRAKGHIVFFDRYNLPVGETIPSFIQNNIRSADLMIFLISQNSVREKKFALSELRYAQRIWKTLSRRVVPVMLEEVSDDLLPDELRSLHYVRQCDAPEYKIIEEIDRLQKRRGLLGRIQDLLKSLPVLIGGAVLVGATSIVIAERTLFPASPPIPSTEFKIDGSGTLKRGETAVFRVTPKSAIEASSYSCDVDILELSHNLTKATHDRNCSEIRLVAQEEPFATEDGVLETGRLYYRIKVAIKDHSGTQIWRGSYPVTFYNYLDERSFAVRAKGNDVYEILFNNQPVNENYQCESKTVAVLQDQRGCQFIPSRTSFYKGKIIGDVTLRHPKTGWTMRLDLYRLIYLSASADLEP